MRLAPLVLLGLLACKDKDPAPVVVGPDDTGGGEGSDDTGDVDCTEPGSWDTVGQPFTLTYCAGCHSSYNEGERRFGAPEGVDLETLAGVQAQAAGSADRVEAGTMPPGAGPSAVEQERWVHWLRCGAPGSDMGLPEGSHEGLAGYAYDTEAYTSTDPDDPAIMVVDRAIAGGSIDFRIGPLSREWYVVDGPEAWLLGIEEVDADEVVIRSVEFDPALQVAGGDGSGWTTEVDVILLDEDGEQSGPRSFTFTESEAVDPDPRVPDEDARQIVGVSEDMELGWMLSEEMGTVAHWVSWPDGSVAFGLQGAGDFGHTWAGDYPLADGHLWAERIMGGGE